MSWILRCRCPTGLVTLSGIDPNMSIADFQHMLGEKTGISSAQQEILVGFPPKTLQLDAGISSQPVSSLPLASGDTLTVRIGAALEPAGTPPAQPQQAESYELAQALAMSLAQAFQGSKGSSQPAVASIPVQAAPAATSTPAQAAPAPRGGSAPAKPILKSAPVGDGSAVVRRLIDSDNSCLFNAVGYVMDRSRSRAAELRKVIAAAVAGDPVTYNDGFLGKENEDYCKWILHKDHWGGAIELSILSDFYGREIAAFDTQTMRCDVYGQDKGFSERVMVVYDGLHYDALAMAAWEDAPEELDVTIFEVHSSITPAVMRAARTLIESFNKARQFTDIGNFTLRCGICQAGITGEKEARAHAAATGHTRFSEF